MPLVAITEVTPSAIEAHPKFADVRFDASGESSWVAMLAIPSASPATVKKVVPANQANDEVI
ncbi:hypothetical protein [Providencia stuartii]|uniref:hypothetical protein n=1 Tax=Providencia stuartii TaxID=588 RepID=UPI002B26F1F4|nr:hypothetical protein [Providencia stuartii]